MLAMSMRLKFSENVSSYWIWISECLLSYIPHLYLCMSRLFESVIFLFAVHVLSQYKLSFHLRVAHFFSCHRTWEMWLLWNSSTCNYLAYFAVYLNVYKHLIFVAVWH
jgi:hypothetical protein